jgi:hypothetical protein
MTAQLIFVHGRAQEHKDAGALKAEWISTWEKGLRESGLEVPIADHNIRFPFYGDTLFDLVGNVPDEDVAEIIIRGPDSTEEQEFMHSVLDQARKKAGISDAQVELAAETEIIEKGPLNWPWVRAIIQAIDRYVPGGSGAAIALATHDIYQYLRNPGTRDLIDIGVRNAIAADVPTVVVSHSLGTVVAYDLLRRDGELLGWKVPLFVTLGSPLAIAAIKRLLRPIKFPACVQKWYNAMDNLDIVALNPLDAANFDVDPAIENKIDLKNQTKNHHGIAGYLNDKDVARRIYDALVR